MMGERKVQPEALFYEFSLERHVPEKHLLRAIDRFVELDGLRRELGPFYSAIGRPSIDPELMIRMLIGLLLRHPLGMAAVRGSPSEPCLPLVSLGGHGCQLHFFFAAAVCGERLEGFRLLCVLSA